MLRKINFTLSLDKLLLCVKQHVKGWKTSSESEKCKSILINHVQFVRSRK